MKPNAFTAKPKLDWVKKIETHRRVAASSAKRVKELTQTQRIAFNVNKETRS